MIQKLIAIRWPLFILLFITTFVSGIWLWNNEQHIAAHVPGFSIMRFEKPETEAGLVSLVKAISDAGDMPRITEDLQIDYVFMAGLYPGIAVWLLMLRRNARKALSTTLLIAALLQFLPWIFDLIENGHLMGVLRGEPLGITVGLFRTMVSGKFFIAFGGAAMALLITIGKFTMRKRLYV